jgi:hypothetical protein
VKSAFLAVAFLLPSCATWSEEDRQTEGEHSRCLAAHAHRNDDARSMERAETACMLCLEYDERDESCQIAQAEASLALWRRHPSSRRHLVDARCLVRRCMSRPDRLARCDDLERELRTLPALTSAEVADDDCSPLSDLQPQADGGTRAQYRRDAWSPP